MSTLAHRYPTLRFPRSNYVERAQTVVWFWNGSIAANGDGLPAASGTPVDYTLPLAGPIEIWAGGGHRIPFGGGFGEGAFGEPGCRKSGGHAGFGAGPFGLGGLGSAGSYVEWTSPFAWRNGDYRIGVRFRDAVGNETTLPTLELALTIAAVPRPATRLHAIGYDADTDTLTIGWRASPDLAGA